MAQPRDRVRPGRVFTSVLIRFVPCLGFDVRSFRSLVFVIVSPMLSPRPSRALPHGLLCSFDFLAAALGVPSVILLTSLTLNPYFLFETCKKSASLGPLSCDSSVVSGMVFLLVSLQALGRPEWWGSNSAVLHPVPYQAVVDVRFMRAGRCLQDGGAATPLPHRNSSRWREGWGLLKIPRGDIDGVGEVK